MPTLANRFRRITGKLILPATLIFLGMPAGFPLLGGKLTLGHDTLFYPPRVVVFQAGLAEGKLLPRWIQSLAGGYGEPYFNFNPPLLYYVTSSFRVLGFGVIRSLNLAVLMLFLLSGLTMYLLASEVFDKAGGMVAGTAYMYAPYMLSYLYVRAAYSELSAIPILPLILWAFNKLARAKTPKYLIIASGAYALLMLCNNPMAVIFTPCLVLMICLMALRSKDASALLWQLSALALGLTLSVFFWGPALAEKDFVQTDKLLHGYLNYQNHFVYFRQLLDSPWGYGTSVPGPQDGMSFQLGAFHIAIAILSMVILLRHGRPPSFDQRWFIGSMLLVVGLAVFIVTESSSFLWRRVTLLQYIQFPWRFLALGALATSVLSAAASAFTQDRGRIVKWLPCLLIPLILASSYSKCRPQGFYDYSDEHFSKESIVTNRLEVSTFQEYRPKWATVDPPGPPVSPISVIRGSAHFEIAEASSTRYRFEISARTDTLMRLNVHYFPGWRVVIDKSQAELKLDDKYGLIEFPVGEGSHSVVAEFKNTPVRTACESLSQLGLVAMLIIAMYATGQKSAGFVAT